MTNHCWNPYHIVHVKSLFGFPPRTSERSKSKLQLSNPTNTIRAKTNCSPPATCDHPKLPGKQLQQPQPRKSKEPQKTNTRAFTHTQASPRCCATPFRLGAPLMCDQGGAVAPSSRRSSSVLRGTEAAPAVYLHVWQSQLLHATSILTDQLGWFQGPMEAHIPVPWSVCQDPIQTSNAGSIEKS